MVISFEEKDRAVIESKGITIIEFKRGLYNLKKGIDETLKTLKDMNDKIQKVWNVCVEKLLEAVDSIRLVFEQISEAYHYQTSRRYRIVKVFSKCTGLDMRVWWNFTFKIRRWLARSRCKIM